MKNKFRTTIYLDEMDYRRLKEMAEREKTTAAEQIREAISRYVAQAEPRALPRSLGSAASGDGELSETAEERLRGFGNDCR
jgi:predicted transcriptional regulator